MQQLVTSHKETSSKRLKANCKSPTSKQPTITQAFSDSLENVKEISKEHIVSVDEDFIRQKDYPNVPYHKIRKKFYFGGMKKNHWIPMSMPHRCIVEANPPRQGYSHLTWNGLNQYYLQQVMDNEEYKRIVQQCNQLSHKAYTMNREESQFMRKSKFEMANNALFLVVGLAIFFLILTEFEDVLSKEIQIAVEIVFAAVILYILLLSIYNFFNKPPDRIFINYEQLL